MSNLHSQKPFIQLETEMTQYGTITGTCSAAVAKDRKAENK